MGLLRIEGGGNVLRGEGRVLFDDAGGVVAGLGKPLHRAHRNPRARYARRAAHDGGVGVSPVPNQSLYLVPPVWRNS